MRVIKNENKYYMLYNVNKKKCILHKSACGQNIPIFDDVFKLNYDLSLKALLKEVRNASGW